MSVEASGRESLRDYYFYTFYWIAATKIVNTQAVAMSFYWKSSNEQ